MTNTQTRTCVYCTNPFEWVPKRGRPPSFCSKECKLKARPDKIRICRNCSAEFIVSNDHVHYCSDSCRNSARRSRELSCRYCGKPIPASAHGTNALSWYCTTKCQQLADTGVPCPVCGVLADMPVPPAALRGRPVFCSPAHANGERYSKIDAERQARREERKFNSSIQPVPRLTTEIDLWLNGLDHAPYLTAPTASNSAPNWHKTGYDSSPAALTVHLAWWTKMLPKILEDEHGPTYLANYGVRAPGGKVQPFNGMVPWLLDLGVLTQEQIRLLKPLCADAAVRRWPQLNRANIRLRALETACARLAEVTRNPATFTTANLSPARRKWVVNMLGELDGDTRLQEELEWLQSTYSAPMVPMSVEDQCESLEKLVFRSVFRNWKDSQPIHSHQAEVVNRLLAQWSGIRLDHDNRKLIVP